MTVYDSLVLCSPARTGQRNINILPKKLILM
jgi:hypothetical protein